VGGRGRDSESQLRVCSRVVELTEPQEARGGAGETGRILRVALDDLLVGVHGSLNHAAALVHACELQPDVRHLRIRLQQPPEDGGGLRVPPVAREVCRPLVLLQGRNFVFRIGKLIARKRERSGAPRANVSKRRQLLTVSVRHC